MSDLQIKKININDDWMKYPVVFFDTETSGAYAIESEIIEIGAIKWFNGKIIDQFQILLKPKKKLTENNIRIHGITNEILEKAVSIDTVIHQFHDFINNCIVVAHHAPFDLGFMALAFEDHQLKFPETLNLCTSLLSRALIATTNHKLQTLVKELKLSGGEAHRAYDDANACLQVFLKCTEKIDPDQTIKRLLDIQSKDLGWVNYSVVQSHDSKLISLAESCRVQSEIVFTYLSGQTKGQTRKMIPLGIVRNPDGDYVHGFCLIDQQNKRFYINKIII